MLSLPAVAILLFLAALTAAIVRWARGLWARLSIVALTVALFQPTATHLTGDISRYLPSWLFSDGSEGKDQVIFASALATLLVAAATATLLVVFTVMVIRGLSARAHVD